VDYSGVFSQLASYTANNTYGIDSASATAGMHLWSTAGGGPRTTITVELTGVAVDSLTFAAHLHSQPCAQEDGGGGYRNDPSLGVSAENTNWPTVTCTGNVCTTETTTLWHPRDADLASGLSINIHDTPAAASGAGARWLCVDLAVSAASGNVTLGSGPGVSGGVSVVPVADTTPSTETDTPVAAAEDGGDDNDDDFTFGQVVGIIAGALVVVALLVAVAQRQWIGNGCPAAGPSDTAAAAEVSAV